MKLSETAYNGVVVLSVTGNLEIDDSEMFRRRIEELVERGKTYVALDLSGCPYVDAVGLGDIVRSYTTISRANGELVLLNPTKRIHDLLSITKLLSVFEVYSEESDAVRALKERLGE